MIMMLHQTAAFNVKSDPQEILKNGAILVPQIRTNH